MALTEEATEERRAPRGRKHPSANMYTFPKRYTRLLKKPNVFRNVWHSCSQLHSWGWTRSKTDYCRRAWVRQFFPSFRRCYLFQKHHFCLAITNKKLVNNRKRRPLNVLLASRRKYKTMHSVYSFIPFVLSFQRFKVAVLCCNAHYHAKEVVLLSQTFFSEAAY